MLHRLVLVCVGVCLGVSQVLAASDDQTQAFELDNGLKLIVREDHRSPLVVSQIWYRVGSSYEPMGHTGLSHFFEHMMFKGTPEYPKDTFTQIIADNGGDYNAMTSADYTVYYQRIGADQLATSFKLEADRMQHLILDQKVLESELNVVKEERRLRIEDNPSQQLYERFAAAAYISTGYHQPVIGWMHDLENMTLEDAQSWYNTWYAPNNAIVVVVGDVKAEDVLALAKKEFGQIPSKTLPEIKPQFEVKALGERRVTVKKPAEVPTILIGFNVPSVSTAGDSAWEPYALSVAAAILDGSNSARLTKILIREQSMASSTGTYYNPFTRLSTLFTVSATPANGVTIPQLEAGLLAQVARLSTELVSEEELARIKTQVIAHTVYEKDSMAHQALQLGALASVGLDWRLDAAFAQNISAITPLQVQEIAKRYLQTDRMTVGVLDPQPMPADQISDKPLDGIK